MEHLIWPLQEFPGRGALNLEQLDKHKQMGEGTALLLDVTTGLTGMHGEQGGR